MIYFAVIVGFVCSTVLLFLLDLLSGAMIGIFLSWLVESGAWKGADV